MSSYLKDTTNSQKRKPDGEGDVAPASKRSTKQTNKRFVSLKSVKRTMSVEQAKVEAASINARIVTKKKVIRSKQKEIRDLKKKLKETEKSLEAEKTEQKLLEPQLKETQAMTSPDSERLLKLARGPTWQCNGDMLVHDMCALFLNGHCTGNDISGLIAIISEQDSDQFKLGALKAIMAMKDSNSAFAPFAKELFDKIVAGPIKTPNVFVELTKSLAAADGTSGSLLQAVLAKAQVMAKAPPNPHYGRYCADAHKCPILDLLKPVYEALEEPAAKQSLGQAMKSWLISSIQASMTVPPTNYSMPELAANAAGRDDRLHEFLLSSTATELRLNLSKNGRLQVHRLIDDEMNAYGKLTHESEGFGRDRILVIRKVGANSPDAEAVRKRRLQLHQQMLGSMM